MHGRQAERIWVAGSTEDNCRKYMAVLYGGWSGAFRGNTHLTLVDLITANNANATTIELESTLMRNRLRELSSHQVKMWQPISQRELKHCQAGELNGNIKDDVCRYVVIVLSEAVFDSFEIVSHGSWDVAHQLLTGDTFGWQ